MVFSCVAQLDIDKVSKLFLTRKIKRRKEGTVMLVNRKCIWIAFMALIVLGLASAPEDSLSQQPYPVKPITVICRSAAGGMADVMTRLLCKALEKELGQPIVVENRAGAGGITGTNYVLKSKPDGYTLGSTSTNTYINSPHLEDITYDPRTDVTDIAAFFKYTHAVCVRTDAPWNTFEEIISYARQNPGKFTFGSGGFGATPHIVMERIAAKEKVKFSYVPFKGGNEAVAACLGNHIMCATQGPADVIQYVQAGKLKILFALNDIRWPITPNIPTVLEKYGFWGLSIQGIFGPKRIPEYIVEKVEKAIKKAVDDPAYLKTAKELQVVTLFMGGKEYQKMWMPEYDVMGKAIKALDLPK
jgi:tripartite-type tricarboxylate transporter receptor subunit TctC